MIVYFLSTFIVIAGLIFITLLIWDWWVNRPIVQARRWARFVDRLVDHLRYGKLPKGED